MCRTRKKTPDGLIAVAVSDETLAELRDAVITRQMVAAVSQFEEKLPRAYSIDVEKPNVAIWIAYVSQLGLVSERALAALGYILPLFSMPVRSRLALNPYAHLRLADGMLKFLASSGQASLDEAATHFDFVIALEQEPIDRELAALAHFWKAQCERRRGKPENALGHASRARDIFLDAGCRAAACMARALEGCLHIEKGRFSRAAELMREAEPVLEESQDLIWRGIIQAGFGDIASEEGRYELALCHFTKAVADLRDCGWRDPAVPKALTSLAHCRRMVATRIARVVDSQAERRRRPTAEAAPTPKPGARRGVEQLRDEAFATLATAIEMCNASQDIHGYGAACLERGFIYLDGGDYDQASVEAAEAFKAGCKVERYALMASACLLNSRIARARYDEGIGDTPSQHAQCAWDFASEALTYALRAEDRPLQADAYICQGLVLCNDFFNDLEAASECCLKAGQFLTSGHRNHLWEEHHMLIRKVGSHGRVEGKFGQWSRGMVEGKTFQEITEEFADLVIPTVWEREGRNISRVVAKLSISPKKVRRILSRAGLKAGIETC